ncbi:uncharacterized protein I303_106441 [Kwoniella dejecticola CBS 10117]|uniref:Secreted protein n=1 Tax=Kwoniella dejecticola CBS 10117 TaxID=1296121 RepID=A0AAJ8KU76_9TREE
MNVLFLLVSLVCTALVVEAQTFVGCYQAVTPTGSDPASTNVASEALCYVSPACARYLLFHLRDPRPNIFYPLTFTDFNTSTAGTIDSRY